jgi:hypothetical protein
VDDGSIAGIANCGILILQECFMCDESITIISNLWCLEGECFFCDYSICLDSEFHTLVANCICLFMDESFARLANCGV